MESKECDPGVPKDSKFIHNKKGLIVGIQTVDGSFDYSKEGQDFLEPNTKKAPVK